MLVARIWRGARTGGPTVFRRVSAVARVSRVCLTLTSPEDDSQSTRGGRTGEVKCKVWSHGTIPLLYQTLKVQVQVRVQVQYSVCKSLTFLVHVRSAKIDSEKIRP